MGLGKSRCMTVLCRTLERRRTLIGGNDYVKNGLYVHYDGINNTGSGHSDVTTYWYDLSPNKNNLSLTLDLGAQWHSNYITYDPGTRNSTWIQMPVSPDFTLEYLLSTTVSKSATTNMNFYTITGSYSSNFNFSRTPNGVNIRVKGIRNLFEFESEEDAVHLISVVVKPPKEIAVYCDGQLIEARQTNIAVLETIQAALGYNNGENSAPKENIRLYAARFYNKALSSAEVLQNYTIDKERYSL